MKLKFLVVLALFITFSSEAKSQTVHCRFSPSSVYANQYRTAILKAAGFIQENSDKNITYLQQGLLLEKPVSCKFTVDNAGQIESLEILKTSGVKTIDQAALALIRKAAPFKFENQKPGTQIVRSGSRAIVTVISASDDVQ